MINVEFRTKCVVCGEKVYLQIVEMRIMGCNCTVNDFTPAEMVPQVAVYGEHSVILIGRLPKLSLVSYIKNDACVAVAALVEPDSIQILCQNMYKKAILEFLNSSPTLEQRGCGSIFMKRA